MNGRTNRRTDGRANGNDRWTDIRTDGRAYGRMDRRAYVRTDGQTVERTDVHNGGCAALRCVPRRHATLSGTVYAWARLNAYSAIRRRKIDAPGGRNKTHDVRHTSRTGRMSRHVTQRRAWCRPVTIPRQCQARRRDALRNQ